MHRCLDLHQAAQFVHTKCVDDLGDSRMANSEGFWSYVHADDNAEGERISRLARDVVAQFEMLTGERLELFLDKDAIKWGEVWRDRVDTPLAIGRILHTGNDTTLFHECRMPP